MANAAPLEIVVYGDAPEGEQSTDTVSWPRDFVEYYEPTGPTIVMPPVGPDGAGGGDLGNAKDNWMEVHEKALWIARSRGGRRRRRGNRGRGRARHGLRRRRWRLLVAIGLRWPPEQRLSPDVPQRTGRALCPNSSRRRATAATMICL